MRETPGAMAAEYIVSLWNPNNTLHADTGVAVHSA